jgi:hypothetical protein
MAFSPFDWRRDEDEEGIQDRARQPKAIINKFQNLVHYSLDHI